MTIDRERSRRFWDRQVTDGRHQADFAPGTLLVDGRLAASRRAIEERNFLRLVRLFPQQTVLDIGCGAGRWALFFAARVQRVVATDFSEAMVGRARAVVLAAGATNVEFRVGDALSVTELPRAEMVHAGGLLQYLSDEDLVVFAERARGRLSGGGCLVTRDSVGPRRVELTGDYPVVYRTEEEYQQLMLAAGFALESRARACFMPTVLPRLIRFLPLWGAPLEWAIALDGRLLRVWPFPALLALHHRVTGRGSGLVLDHRFAVWRPVSP